MSNALPLKPLVTAVTLALLTSCAMQPAKDHYASVEDFAAELPRIDLEAMHPTHIGNETYIGTNVWGRGKCPVYATVRLPDHQIRHFQYCNDKAPPVEIHPKLRPWPDTPEAEFVVEQTVENLFADRRFFIKNQKWNGFKIVAFRSDFKYDDKGCERMRGYAYDWDPDAKRHKGLVYFYQTKLCKES